MRSWILALLLSTCVWTLGTTSAGAAVVSGTPAGVPRAAEQQSGGSSLEAAAAKAGNTGRAVAMSLIGLAFAVAGTVLAFRRDFKEAAAVFAVGIIAVLLATTAGVSLLRDTVTSLFGSH
jgi:glucose uptake protein GlcU